MKNKDSWNSEFRKQKFYEKQKKKNEKAAYELTLGYSLKDTRDKGIVILLDLQGTCDFIDSDKAQCFIKQIEKIRKKFQADKAVICISTQYPNSSAIKEVFDIISPHLPRHIEIGTSFFCSGTYDYDTDCEICKRPFFNSNKLETFRAYYLLQYDYKVEWFAFIDDGASDDIYKEFQKKKPMLLAKPSQSEGELSYNNFMRVATTTKGFDGVLECLDCYIHSLHKLPPRDILTKQKNMICHLSSLELGEKALNRDFTFLEKYFQLGFADNDDYNDVLQAIFVTLKRLKPTDEEIGAIQNILSIVNQRFIQNQDEKRLEKVRLLRDEFRM